MAVSDNLAKAPITSDLNNLFMSTRDNASRSRMGIFFYPALYIKTVTMVFSKAQGSLLEKLE